MRKSAANRMTALLAGAAAVLVLCTSPDASMSYFTTYVTAQGSQTMHLQKTTPGIQEEFEGNTKVITAKNDGERDCYVRVACLAPMACTLSGDANWTDGHDGYWYYALPLAPGAQATALRATPVIPDEVREDFNIIVTVESAPVLYEGDAPLANGPGYAGWDLKPKAPVPVTGNP